MSIAVAEVRAELVCLLHQLLAFREGASRNLISRAEKTSNIRLTNLVTIMHAANFFIEAQLG